MPAADILELPPGSPNNIENTYRAADGQILQSSMVKSGSPTKRKTTGSISQVRFSLPPPDSDHSFENDSELDIVQGFEDTDDFEKRSIFNLGSRELEAPIRGRSCSRESNMTIGDSMRQLVSQSPERNRLFIRGDSELNSQPLPIPVELQLPPLLSPNNKSKRRPTSLIYNGAEYEPFEFDLRSFSSYTKPEVENANKSLPIPTSSNNSKKQIERSIQPLYSNNATKEQIEIPDLNKHHLRTPTNSKTFELDNEKEIRTPSPAAKQQNNRLNREFSFPQKPPPERQPATLLEKDLPQLPPNPNTYRNPPSSGLEIYTEDGPLNNQHHHPQSSYGRFVTNQVIDPTPPQEEQPYENQYRNQDANYIPHSLKKGHYHRRSRSQIIDFPVDKLNELPNVKQDDYKATGGASQSVKEVTQAIEPEIVDGEEDVVEVRQLTPESQYSSYDEGEEVSPPDQGRYSAQREDSFDCSVQSSVDITPEDAESIQSTSSMISEKDDPDQLLDLGRLIITSRSEVNLPNSLKPRSTSTLLSETSVTEPLHIRRESPQKNPPTQIQKPIQPLGSQHQPQIVHLSDNFVPEHIRQISHSRVLVNRIQQHQQGSPNPSQTSYETDYSEPFSATSSAQTAQTTESIHRAGSIMVDLTNDNYDVTTKKDDRNTTLDQYKSVFDKVDGKYRETIVLDDDDDDHNDEESRGLNHVVKPLNIRHKRSKSALGNLEFCDSNRTVSNFSFETVASEVQLHYDSSEETSHKTIHSRQLLNYLPRTYTTQNKSVIELCDDTMTSTRQVLDQLQRQRTHLLKKHTALKKSKDIDEARLSSVRELQANLMKKRNLKVSTRPQSCVYGEDLNKTLQKREQLRSENYFDYKNDQSYNFETFMRSKSSTALV